MSSDKSSSKGKAVAVKEEPLVTVKEEAPVAVKEEPLVAMKEEAPAVDAEQEVWLVKRTAPRRTGAQDQEGGSSSQQPPPAQVQVAAAAPVVPPANVVPDGSEQPQPAAGGGANNYLSLFVKDVMVHCVTAIGAGNLVLANGMLHCLLSSAAAAGADVPLQRVVLVFAEALARRVMRVSLPSVAAALGLQSTLLQPPAAPTTAARRRFAAQCPLVRVAAKAANHAVLEALAEERGSVHVVDLGGAADPEQWRLLLGLLATRPGGPPSSLRFTLVNDDDEFLSHVAGLLTREAMRLRVPFVFKPVRAHIDDVSPLTIAALGVVRGGRGEEALVISSTLQIHRLIADEISVHLPQNSNSAEQQPTAPQQLTRAEALLRVLCDLKPKLLVLTEREADHNAPALADRLRNAFEHYTVLFRDMEAGGGHPRVLLKEEIVDIVAYDGAQRRERHEKIARWAARMQWAGFEPAHVTDHAFSEAANLAQQLTAHCKHWMFGTQRAGQGCVLLYSRQVPIFSVSAWKPVHNTD